MQKCKLHILVVLLCTIGVMSLTGCGKGESKKGPSQVAAKVNDAEISMHQINLLMKSAQNVTADNAASVRQQILEKLIDQQIIVEKANKENLDRTPDVMMAIEAAKKDILARAYLQKLVSTSIKVTDQEVKKYYDSHTELFAKRKIYNLQDIGMEKNAEILASVNDDVSKQKSMQEIADSLKGRGVKYSGGSYTRPAEQLPLDILPKLQDLHDGETIVLETQNAVHVVHLVKAKEAPMDIAAATPLIKNYFINTRGKQIVDEEMKKFRKEAKIEYVGDFVAEGRLPKASVDNSSESTKLAEDKKVKSSGIEAGVAGLK